MGETRRFNYEAMFLFGQAAAADLAGSVEHIRDILTRAGAEVIAMRKWDERRLAYEIDKHKRGIYILVYFSCDAPQMDQIVRDTNLSERILRTMILRVDHLSLEEMQAADAQQALADEAALRKERGQEDMGADDDRDAAPVGVDESEEM